jgi:electron transfer flavoprotein beta subunit
MKTLVCLKQILDPEISPRDFQVDSERLEAVVGSANLVTNIFCENALETALQLRDQNGGEIAVLTFGGEQAEETLRKALALKADHACRVDDPGIGRSGSDSTALVLAAAVRKLGEFDLIMLGREAGDWGEGRTAGLLAEHLDLPLVSFVDQIQCDGMVTRLWRQTDFGREELSAHVPLVISITNNDANVPRIPKTRDIMMAHRKELTTWSLQEVGLDEETVRRESTATQVVELFVPERTSHCEFIPGDTTEERIAAFAERVADVLKSV